MLSSKRRPPCAALSLILLALCGAMPAHARCADDDAKPAATAESPAAPPVEPRLVLQGLVRESLARSQAVGATRLLAEAATLDVEEARALQSLRAGLNLELGPAAMQSGSVTTRSPMLARSSLNVSKLLYDGGRSDRLIDWRGQLAEAARLGHLTQQEQVALNTVALALERSRYRQQVQVYGQYVRKMGCLAEALETIVRADRGRASELVQARKSMQQAEIAQAQAQSAARQVEVRLRRLVGDGLPGIDGLSSVLLAVPELPIIEAEVARSSEIAQLAAQAAAMGQYAAAVEAGGRPQVSWSFGGAKTIGNSSGGVDQRSGSLSVGVSVNIPLLDPGIAPSAEAARKRAQAAVLQREEALETRRYKVRETHEQTLAAFDRAGRVSAVLRDSEQVRASTLQQWQQLGRRSLFDVMSAEADHYNLRVAYINALFDGQQMNALLLSLGRGVSEWLR
ncbi:MAG: TolC family protein [Rubrivivax sp.]|nr:TolC family protein [Rubrivivax sp.]